MFRLRSSFTSSAPATTVVMAGEEAAMASQYPILVDQCRMLEASLAALRRQFDELLLEKQILAAATEDKEDCNCCCIPGFFYDGSPYRRILELIGHAVHVCSASTGEIIYWNQSAENLYGWKDYEVIGQRMDQLLAAEEHIKPLQNIMSRFGVGQPWSGQFPFKKISGEVFMAIATMNPLYEDGQLVGFVMVSSDAAYYNSLDLENLGNDHNCANKRQEQNQKKVKWPPRPQIRPVPQIASSVSNLASKFLLRRSVDTKHIRSAVAVSDESQTGDALLEKSAKLAEKLLEKLHIGGTRNNVQESKESSQQNVNGDEAIDLSALKKDRVSVNANANASTAFESCSKEPVQRCYECFDLLRKGVVLPDPNQLNSGSSNVKDNMLKECSDNESPDSGGRNGSHGSGSCGSDSVFSSMVDCEIRWEELEVGEVVGQGSFAAVHRGIWKGSDVAIKAYFACDYDERTLQDYKKEVEIMKRLRHPNVLLFMGAVYSQERLAIITELLPRGSLFKVLHKSKQATDIRRRLRMALDVARGMNYLHHRNPPIVHRDLKSSNLLVDRNWNVKVGDFGLSKLMNTTLMATHSGRGTPQWMAPEVLRNEPSNEKSDVFSFGVVLWELMTQSVPWNNLNSLQVVGVVGFMDRRLDLPEGIDPEIAAIIHDCWHSDPNQRPSFEEVLQRITSLIQRLWLPQSGQLKLTNEKVHTK